MSNTHRPEVQAFYNGKSRPTAIRDYLNLNRKCAREVARLAASMAPAPKTFDPSALVSAALALRAEADAGLARSREALVVSMNFRTLLGIAHELGVADKIHANEDDEMFSDPVAGPVLRILKRVNSKKSADRAAQDAASMEKVLVNADSRTKLKRPSLPCNLEVALRYAANAPGCRWSVLECAFKDFLSINRAKRDAKDDDEYRTDIQAQLERDTKDLADLKLKARTDPQLLSQQRKLQKKVNEFCKIVSRWKTIQSYLESFMPGTKPPAGVAEESARIYAESWQHPGSVSQESSLASLAADFHAFWQAHGKEYLRQHQTAERQRKLAAKRNRESGAKGAATRDHKVWLGHTTAFTTLLNKGRNRKTPADIQSLVETYAENHSGLKDKAAMTKVKAFLGTLSNLVGGKWDAVTARRLLLESGIKGCPEKTIGECLSLLDTALGRDRGKK